MAENRSSRWTFSISWKSLLFRWVTLVVGMFVYMYVLKLIGVTAAFDWEQFGNVVVLGTLILFLIGVYGRPRNDKL
ncbi:MAG: hypothetical protein Q4D85_00655 [Corynebacterium sp.]|uniref:hypothetical protein n=1 Tax=Corynebacterium sp. TaxID=1720 RepID=UPI0026DC7859|nr:hypothetical protein [Corynebacterium sp.]MDO5097236.1 hypothetical protein [Corynebacterium sp.]